MDPDEVFENKYYRLNKKMMQIVTLWPYRDSPVAVLMLRIILCIGVASLMIVQMTRAIEEFFNDVVNTEIILENFSGFCFFLAVITKFSTSLMTEKKFKRLYEEIMEDWNRITDFGEIEILHKFSHIGFQLNVYYMVYVYGSTVLYVFSPAVIPVILNAMNVNNGTFDKALCLHAEYFIDQQKYFYYLFLHTLLSSVAAITILFAIDITFVTCVQHAVSLINISMYRLKRALIVTIDPEFMYSKEKEEDIHNYVLSSIKIHKEFIEFINSIQSAYNVCFLLLTGLLLIGLSTFSVDLVLNLGNPVQFLRIGTLWLGGVIYIFYINWPSQKLINASYQLHSTTYECGWYRFPRKTRNLVKFMMLRCSKPSRLTAGPLLVMNMQACGFILRTAFSYFTAVTAMHSEE